MSEAKVAIGVVGGKINFKPLTLQLQKESEKEYKFLKVHVWLKMLNDSMQPTRWLKPNKNGTNINFKGIMSQQDYDYALAELKVYIDHLNKEYPELELEIK